MVCHLPPLHIGQQEAWPCVPSSWESPVAMVLPHIASKHTISNILQQEQKCFSPADTEGLTERSNVLSSGPTRRLLAGGRRACARNMNGKTRVIKPTNTVVTSTTRYPFGGHHLLLRPFWQKMSSALAPPMAGTSVGCRSTGCMKTCTGRAPSVHPHLVGSGACGSQWLQIDGHASAHVAPSSCWDPSAADPLLLVLAAGHDLNFGGSALYSPWAAQVELVWLLCFWPWLPLPNRSACDLPLRQQLLASVLQH